MPIRLADKETQVSKEEVITALWKAWVNIFGAPPKKQSIWLLVAQWALETGHGKHMHCFNMGNVKSRDGDGYDFNYFACNEILKTAEAQRYAAKNPDIAKITANRADGKSIIWFYPDHPGCRFRAFDTLDEGAIDHLAILSKRFSSAWPAVLAGDPAQFSHLIKMQGYYTQDEPEYTKPLVSLFGTVSRIKFDYDSLPTTKEVPPLPTPSEEGFTAEDKVKIHNLLVLSMQQTLEESTHYTRILSDGTEDIV